MKKHILTLLLAMLGVSGQAQTEDPKQNPQVQQKFAEQIAHHYFVTHDYWQLERLCDEKEDSICPPILAWGRGVAAARFFQFDRAKEQLGLYVEKYQNVLPEIFMIFAADHLTNCLWWQQEHDEAAKVCDMALQFFADEGLEDEHEGAINRFTEKRDRNLAFARLPKTTMTCLGDDVRIPFRVKTLKKQKQKNKFMIVDGSVQGKSVPMLYDTGFGFNAISRQLAKELHLTTIDAEIMIDAADQANTSIVMADSLRIGNATFHNVKFIIVDADNDQVSDLSQVVVGQPMMQLMTEFTIDFRKKIITSPAQPADYQGKSLAFDTEGGTIFVRLHHNDKPIDMMIDTGNGGDSHLGYDFYKDNQEEVDRCKTDSVGLMGVVGMLRLAEANMKKFAFTLNDKQYHFPVVSVLKTEVDAALGENNMGLPFLSRFRRVTISYKDAHIELEK